MAKTKDANDIMSHNATVFCVAITWASFYLFMQILEITIMFSFICCTIIIRVSTFFIHIINYVLYTEIRMFYKINIIGRGLIAAYASIGIRL